MASIRGKNTLPELRVRRAAHALGLRFRLHSASLPGRPDLAFPRWKTVIFVHGCFWHRHGCGAGNMPKTNPEYWRQKFERNLARDRKNIRDLHKLGWRVAVIWECQTLDANSLSRRLARVFHLTSEVLAR